MTIEEMLSAQYKMLGHEGLGYTEFRLIIYPRGQVTIDWANDEKSFIELGVKYAAEKEQMVFVGLNPRKTKEHGNIENIQSLNVLMLDVDPIRPTGEGSNDEDHTKALVLGHKIWTLLGGSVLVDSGSGVHVYIPIEPISIGDDPKTFTKRLEQYHKELRKKYETEGFRIDATFDLPRCTRLWSSFNPKSKRTCYPVSGVPTTARTKIILPEVSFASFKKAPISNEQGKNERFKKLVKNNKDLQEMMEGKGEFPSRSEADFKFISILAKSQFTTSDIKNLARLNPLGRGTELLDKDVERVVEKIESNGIGSVSLHHGSQRYLANLQSRKTGYSTGLAGLDERVAGLHGGRLYVIAARTGEGKTSLATHIALHVAKQNVPVLYCSTELPYESIFDKVISSQTGIELRRFQAGFFTTEENKKIKEEVESLSNVPLIIEEDQALTAEKIAKRAKEIVPGLIVIDHLHAMQFFKGGEPQELRNTVKAIKDLNTELAVPIILGSQFNRAAIGAPLSLSQLKGSSAIAEFADTVIAINPLNLQEDPVPTSIILLKNRYGTMSPFRINFNSKIGKFEEVSK